MAVSFIQTKNLDRIPYEESKEVWKIFWDGIYMKMPKNVYQVLMDRMMYDTKKICKKMVGTGMKSNLMLPNSYPHQTKNP